jgi:FSR family fosmidomycin resistance protein-like MFS transporter
VQRLDLGMTYAQVGLLLGLPHLVNLFVEPILMLLGDTVLRKRLVIGGGFALTLSLLLTATAPSYPVLLAAAIFMFPASGAFVSLSQAVLMDLHPGRESQMMARWVVAGSLANLTGPLLLAVLFALAFSWRTAFLILAGLALLLTLWTARQTFPSHIQKEEAAHPPASLKSLVLREARTLADGLKAALVQRSLWRWILMLQLADLMMDVLTSYTPLYFTDVVGVSETQASLLLSFFMVAALASDLIVVRLLERFPGLRVVRWSAVVIAVLFPAWLLIPGLAAKIGLIFAIKLLTLGWYTVLMGEAFAAMPERKGTLLALLSVSGVIGSLFPWLVGWAAGQVGLQSAMWLLLAGPLSLLILLPSPRTREAGATPPP